MKGPSQLRKVQLTGGSTYVVSLPKNWAKAAGIKPGDYVQLIPQPDTSLLIVPGEGKKREELSEALIDASLAENPEDTARELIACYLVGYDIIRLRFGRKAAEHRIYIKDVMRRKLVGVEIIDEAANYMTIRCLLGHVEFPVKDALSRMHIMALSMHKDAITALRERNISLAHDVAQRDDEVDRLYFFVVRQLKMATQKRFIIEEIGLTSLRDCLGYRLVAKSLERIADHAARIAQTIPTMEYQSIPDDIMAPITSMSTLSAEICQNAMKALYQLSIKKANQAIAGIAQLTELEEKVIKLILESKLHITTVVGLRLTLESIRRAAEYGADIAEIAINLTKKL
ncbi:phosphate uptake regulator PhoU [Candidatus Bathyarchaeota archaeon]|nr:MAG: phosphate uptake regulator PhoU [Candidatus Bathyarchaeota archaeon]